MLATLSSSLPYRPPPPIQVQRQPANILPLLLEEIYPLSSHATPHPLVGCVVLSIYVVIELLCSLKSATKIGMAQGVDHSER